MGRGALGFRRRRASAGESHGQREPVISPTGSGSRQSGVPKIPTRATNRLRIPISALCSGIPGVIEY